MRADMLPTMGVSPPVIRQLHPPLFIYRVWFIGLLAAVLVTNQGLSNEVHQS
jgi:hypothetical protein